MARSRHIYLVYEFSRDYLVYEFPRATVVAAFTTRREMLKWVAERPQRSFDVYRAYDNPGFTDVEPVWFDITELLKEQHPC